MKKSDMFLFHTDFSPSDFLERLKVEAVKENMKAEKAEKGFDLQIGSNHGGKVIYSASVTAAEGGGTVISGELVTVPWTSGSHKKKNLLQKILSVFGYIVVFPIVLILVLCYGVYRLFAWLFRRNIDTPTDREKLCDFMLKRMCCEQEEFENRDKSPGSGAKKRKV